MDENLSGEPREPFAREFEHAEAAKPASEPLRMAKTAAKPGPVPESAPLGPPCALCGERDWATRYVYEARRVLIALFLVGPVLLAIGLGGFVGLLYCFGFYGSPWFAPIPAAVLLFAGFGSITWPNRAGGNASAASAGRSRVDAGVNWRAGL